MVGASFKAYENYPDFITDFLFVVLADGTATIIVDYKDTQGVVQSLNEKVLNGNSLALAPECFDNFDSDVTIAKERGGLIMITVMKDGEILTDPVIYTKPEAFVETTYTKPEAFVETTYFVEYDAKKAVDLPLEGTIIPFLIKKHKI